MQNVKKYFSLISSFYFLICIFSIHAECTNPSDFDRSFGPQNNGIVTIDFGVQDFKANGGILIDDEGRIVASGTQQTSANDFAVVRLLSNGQLDTSFGANKDGKVIIDFAPVLVSAIGGLVRDTQGRLVVSGVDFTNNNYVLARLLENGSLDQTFGIDGKVVGTSNDISSIFAMALNKDGKIVLLGRTASVPLIIQLNPDGSLDTNFGNGGRKEIDFGITNGVVLVNFVIDTHGRIVIVGDTTGAGPIPNSFVSTRLNSDGSFDKTFGVDGKVIIDNVTFFDVKGLSLTRAGKIVILCVGINGILLVAQLLDDGSLDPAFGNNGLSFIDGFSLSVISQIAIDSWGNIYLTGQFSPVSGVVTRIKSNGLIDPSFGSKSISFPFGIEDITIDAQGRVLLLGGQNTFSVARLCGDQSSKIVTDLREKYRANCSVLP